MWMPFQKKYERARRFQREQMGLPPEEETSKGRADEELPPDSQQPLIHETMEKGDMAAMFLSAFLTLFLPSVLVIGVIVLLAFLLFGII